MTKVVWSIAGSDCSNGAGIQCDSKVFYSLGLDYCTIITAVTAQNINKFISKQIITPDIFQNQITACLEMGVPKAIKIGMLGSNDLVDILADFLKNYTGFVILDPIIKSTTQVELNQNQNYLLNKLGPYCDLVTPNQLEFNNKFNYKNILVTDSTGQDKFNNIILKNNKINSNNTHGTGCCLSSAIAGFIALGEDLNNAVILGKAYVTQAIRAGKNGAVYPDKLLFNKLDFPVIKQKESFLFKSCGPERLGFYPVVDNLEWLEKLINWNVKTIQLRIKNNNNLEKIIKTAVKLSKENNIKLFINDHWELACKYKAYGVHLGQEDLDTADLSKISEAGLRLGISTHDYFELSRALGIKPSYIALGPIYETTLKQMDFNPQGLEKLKKWIGLCDCPIVAIGGINKTNYAQVADTGVDGIAMVSGLTKDKNPLKATGYFQQIFSDGLSSHPMLD